MRTLMQSAISGVRMLPCLLRGLIIEERLPRALKALAFAALPPLLEFIERLLRRF